MTTSRVRLHTSGLLLAGAVLLALLAACGSSSSPTTSAPPTSLPTLPSSTAQYLSAGLKWVGQENQHDPASTFQTIFTVASVQGTSFSGTIEYPDASDTITKMSGTIVTSFAPADLQYWRAVPGFASGTAGTYVKFTETDFVQGGSNIELNDAYYGLIQPNGSFQGVWFRPNETQPNGDFLLQPQPLSA